MNKILSALILVSACSASAATLYVNKTGSGGAFTSVQAAINAAAVGTSSNRTIIYIAPGTYKEQVVVSSSKRYLCLIGQTADATQVVITYNLNAGSPNGSGGTVGTTGSTTFRVNAPDFIAKNITFQNSTHDGGGQAVAMLTYNDRLAFKNCRFFGFQDTLSANNGRQFFDHCYITGDTDFIFGDATALFGSCYINQSGPWGYNTAANTSPGKPVGYVFKYCALTATPITTVDPETGTHYSTVTSVSANQTYLGRSWQYTTSKSSVAYISCKMGSHIIAAGWSPWDSGNTNPAATTRYSEYGSTDLNLNPLDLSGRVSWSHILTATEAGKYSTSNIFGPVSYWGSSYTDWGGTYTAWDAVAALNSVPNQ